jgi:uncharacterized membrane protein HdeD (DUF308 family)
MGSWLAWLVIGIFFVLGGVFCFFNPLAATLTAEQMAAWLFIIGGVAQAVAAFRAEGWGARVLSVILALAYLWLGISLLSNPLAGILTLTLVVAIMFFVNGSLKVVLAFSTARGTGAFWPILISGVVSVVLAIMVITNFPQSAAVLLGVLLAIELLSSGLVLIAYALALKNGEITETSKG